MTSILWMLVGGSTAHAAEPEITPEIRFRPRLEADSGRDFTAGAGNVAFVTHRAQLGATIGWGPVSARVVFQDVRAWGEEADTRRDFAGDGIDLAVGTFTWRPHPHLTLVVGRDEVSLHEERLVARANWRQPGRRFDGARLIWEDGRWAAELAGFLAVDGDVRNFDTQDQVLPGTADQILAFARAGRQAEALTAQGVVVVDSRQEDPGNEVFRITPGAFVSGTRGPLRGHVEAYTQLGTRQGGAQRVSAWMLGVSATLAPDHPTRPRLSLRYDALSGDRDPTDGVFTSFDTIRGANHRHYGHIDIATFFRGGGVEAQGLHDPHVELEVSPMPTLTFGLDQHLFAPAAVAPGAARWIAVEPDLYARFEPHPAVTLSGGVSAWADLAPRRPVELWAWCMLDVQLAGPTLRRAADEPADTSSE